MAASGVMVIVRIGVRKSEIARISGIGRWRQGAARHTLGSLIEVTPEGTNRVEQDWEEIELAVDSGATEMVVGTDMVQAVQTRECSAFRRGVQYEVASGELMPNLGEKEFIGVSDTGEVVSRAAAGKLTQ